LHPQPKFHKRGAQSPTQNQPLLLLLQELYKHTQKDVKIVVLETKEESKAVSRNAEEAWERAPSSLPWAAEPARCSHQIWQAGIWVTLQWYPPGSPSCAGRSG